MRAKKLIAILVAGLFAEGTAWADDNFNWSGTLELGGRATNTDGGERNGARGTSATTLVPFKGPEDAAKAQEYQDPSSGVIGVIDVRGSSRSYYMSLFGENLGRDDQYVNARGGTPSHSRLRSTRRASQGLEGGEPQWSTSLSGVTLSTRL